MFVTWNKANITSFAYDQRNKNQIEECINSEVELSYYIRGLDMKMEQLKQRYNTTYNG